ncbi:MAG TPA: 5-formyltetrahydrofolate cyclo-ligase [Candidatus Saccharimonadales bacterium]|nr:5-formyltetrahydrofolate cyclo-ligase [Candidatus Saccharimonadales bacterium]
MNKSELRRRLQQVRQDLPAAERAAFSREIAARLLRAVEWPNGVVVHCFEPIARLAEVDLTGFMAALRAEHHAHIYASHKVGGQWRIVSVGTDKPAAEPRFDVIIVPMLGFDPQTLYRIGYGGGYYDRFLAEQPQAHKIGVCFEAGKLQQLPAEPHDVAMDLIVTEGHSYTP